MLGKVRNTSIFRRLTIVYSITVLAMYLVMVTLLIVQSSRAGKELINTRWMQTQSFMEGFENNLDQIYEQQLNLTIHEGVAKLAYQIYSDEYEKTQLILNLEKTLQGIKSLHSLVKDVKITFPSEDFSISAVNGYLKENYGQNVNSDVRKLNRSLSYTQEGLELIFSYPLRYSITEDYEPDYIIRIFLSNESIRGSLKVFEDQLQSGAGIIYLDKQGDIGEDYIIGTQEIRPIKAWIPIYRMNASQNSVRHEGSSYRMTSALSTKYPLLLATYMNNKVMDQIMLRQVLFLTLITIAISSLFVIALILTRKVVIKPLEKMVSAFHQLQEGDLNIQIYHEPHDEFNYLYHAFNDTVEHIQQLIHDIYEQQSLRQSAELAQLQSQINPHFLYNSFFIINRMAKTESYEQISRFVTSLAKYYRFLNKEKLSHIELVEEVEHMINYIDIQQMRFGDKIEIQREELPIEIHQVMVPKLILQPLIENAYNYGLADTLDNGLIRIQYRIIDNYIHIIIEDNGNRVDDELVEQLIGKVLHDDESKTNHALNNIHRRLCLAFGEESGIYLAKSNLGGLQVTLRIRMSRIDG